MNRCFEIIPLDTWFFRGSTPMESGMMNIVSIFPPPVSVIKGTFWTELCNSKNKDYSYGMIDGNIPFEVTGIFIKKDDSIYVAAPATWYYDCEKKITNGSNLKGIPLKIAKKNNTMTALGMTSSAGDVYFVKAEQDSKSLSGAWIKLEFLKKPKDTFESDSVLFPGDIYSLENRTNVALDENRRAKDGQLFSSTHIRINDGFSLVTAFDKELDLMRGKFFFGGEKRISEYKGINELNIDFTNTNGEGEYMSLVPVEATEETVSAIITSGKLYLTAGWDMKKRYHKPSSNWIPAGAVFNRNINGYCIKLAEVK